MAQSAETLQEERLLRQYLRLLAHYGGRPEREVSPGHDIRNCARCGQSAIFRIDPEGGWATCTACGEYA